MTETGCIASINPYYADRKVGSIGLPIRGQEMKIVDQETGEISEAGAGQGGRDPGAAQQLDRLAVFLFGGASPGYQCPGPRRRPASPVAGARHG